MMKDEKLIYTNELGEKVEMSFFNELVCVDFDDELSVNYSTTKNAMQDGETFVSQNFDTRPISIDCIYQVRRNYESFERHIRKVFNPQLKGILTHLRGNVSREIDVKVEAVPKCIHKGMKGSVSIDLIAFSPFWKDRKVTDSFTLIRPAFRFPQSFMGGVAMGIQRSSLVTDIENVGDVACGIKVTFKARDSVTNPNIKMGEKTIRIVYEMMPNDIVEVDMTKDSPVVRLNGSKTNRIIDRMNSDFFKLEVGKNHVEYNAEKNVTNMDVIVEYQPLYL